MNDPSDPQQVISYLSKLAATDPSFTYKIARSENGSLTGFIWQTRTMRRDFELFGDILFVDCLGRNLNTKGWPINTVAMLDGERKVCIPCEAITIGESVDAYAWIIKSAVEMTPKRKLSDIKIIFGDGILARETLLTDLGIANSCKLLLDHHHLISDEIGAWPKEFGPSLWSQLKTDLYAMVYNYSEEEYNSALSRVKEKVRQNPQLSKYVEENIHSKRHLFANHIVKTYPCTMNYHGSAPAEANHWSIIARLGSIV
jgi:hypothetical protein